MEIIGAFILVWIVGIGESVARKVARRIEREAYDGCGCGYESCRGSHGL